MRILAPALLVLSLVPAGAWAQAATPDPLKSAECVQAREALEAARAEKSADGQRVEQLRRAAAGACLGLRGAAPAPARVAQDPLRVPPPADLGRPQQRPPLFAAPEAPEPAPKLPPVITSCDAGGCWDSNGTRLNRAGPNLLTPGGSLCTRQGVVLNCP